jgi:hypothetical protein
LIAQAHDFDRLIAGGRSPVVLHQNASHGRCEQ